MSSMDPPMSTPAPNEKWRVSWGAEPQLAGATVDILAPPNEDGMVKVQRIIVDGGAALICHQTLSYGDHSEVGEADRSKQEFAVYVVMPRKDVLAHWSCPITHAQEGEVLEWLRSPRILGHLRKWWEPLLDQIEES